MFEEINAGRGLGLTPHILTGHTCTLGVLVAALPELRVCFLLVRNSFDGARPFPCLSFLEHSVSVYMFSSCEVTQAKSSRALM